MWDGLAALMMTLAGLGSTWLVQATVLLALGLLAGQVLRRSGPAVLSGIYRTTLAAILICPVASAVLIGAGVDGLALRWPGPVNEPATAPRPPAVSRPVVVARESDRRDVLLDRGDCPLERAPRAREEEATSIAAKPMPPAPTRRPSPRRTLAAAAAVGFAVWGMGATVIGLRLWVGLIRMRRLRGSAVPAEPDAAALCRDVARRMNVGAPTVWRSPFLFSPCLDGLRRPAILLPDDVDGNLMDIFVHELAHLVRRDGFWNLLRRSAGVVFWVHPLFWVLTRRLEAAAEEVCDDYVVQFGADRARYAGHLLELAGRALPPVAPAGVGMISLRSMLARRIVRILDTSRTLSTQVGSMAVLAMLTFGLAGTLLAGLLVIGGRREAKAQGPAKAVEAKDGLGRREDVPAAKTARADIPITGRVVDLEGRPVSGASVWIVSTAAPKSGNLDNWMAAVRGGETPITASRHLDFVSEPAAAPREVTTDAQGRFQFQGVASERLVHLAVRGPTIASAMFTAATRPFGPIPARGFRSSSGTGVETIFGADFTFTATPGRLVEGTVRDSRTRRPLAGVEIQSKRVLSSNRALMPILKTAADELGRFRLTGLPKGIRNIIIAVPGEDQSYLTREVAVPDSPGIAPISVDVELHRGLWIEGKVTDNATGRPIEGARLHYFPFLDNKYAQALPEFHPGGSGIDHTVLQHQYTTKPDGTYRMVGLPGRAIVGVDHGERLPYRSGFGAEAIGGMDARGYFPTWKSPGPPGRPWPLSMKEIDPAEGTEGVRVDLQLDPGASVRVRAIDPQGQPLTGLKVMRRTSMGSLEGVPRAEFDVVALGVGEERRLAIWHEGRDLGKVVSIRQGDDKEGPVVMVLEPMATIVGRVLDGDGQPVSGATIEPRPLPEIDFNLRLPRVTTDKEGRFRAPDVPVGCDYRLWSESRDRAINGARGASDAVKVRPGETTDVGDIRLKRGDGSARNAARPDVPINGRIVDLEGRPVAGVLVKLGDVQGSKSADLTPWIEGVRNGEPPWIAFHHNEEIKIPETVKSEATTDADGRFRFEGLGGERVAELSIAGDTIACTTIKVATRKIEPFPAPGFADHYGPGTRTVYGADFTFTTAPSRPIEGVVRDAKTKQPLAGVSVESEHFAGSDYVEIRTLKSVTDERGRFRIVGMPKGKGNGIVAVPNDDQPYFMRELKVGDPSGIAPVAVEVELHRGVLIAGKITDKVTGKPVGDVRLHYLPFLDNPYVQALPEFKDGNADGSQYRYTTKADGTYRLVGMPGRAIVGVESIGKTPYRSGAGAESIAGRNENGQYETWNNPIRPSLAWPNTLVEINPVEGTEELALDAQLDPGLSVRFKVVDADGNALDDASVEQGNRFHAAERAPDASVELVSLRPDEVRTVVIRHVGRKLGTVARLRPGDDAKGPVVVSLAPLASIKGRAVDAYANPVPAALVRLTVESTDSFIHTFAEVVSDRGGRFEVLNVPTGCNYGVSVVSDAALKRRRYASGKAVVKPGEATDVGDLAFKND